MREGIPERKAMTGSATTSMAARGPSRIPRLVCAAIAALIVVGGYHFCRAAGVTVRVLLATAQSLDVRVPEGATITDETGAAIARVTGEAGVTFRSRGAAIVATVAGRELAAPGIEVRPEANGSAWFVLGGSRYRGILRIIPGQEGNVLGINVLPMEEYLYGVVGCEMPAGWPEEALKAQSVAARSFAMSCREDAACRGALYDLASTTEGQIYRGIEGEDPRTSAAVDSTTGVILVHSGEPVRAVFHSCSGGHTESSEFVWSTAVSYLRGVEDPYDDSPHRSWEVRAAASQIEGMLAAAGIDPGRLSGIRGIEAGASGRWSKILVTGSTGESVLRGSEFRKALGLKSAWFTVSEESAGWEEVVSQMTGQAWAIASSGEVKPVPSRFIRSGLAAAGYRYVPGGYVFQGRGYGHGVGLSQWGARALANRGHKYPEILQHYYSETRLDGSEESAGVDPGKP